MSNVTSVAPLPLFGKGAFAVALQLMKANSLGAAAPAFNKLAPRAGHYSNPPYVRDGGPSVENPSAGAPGRLTASDSRPLVPTESCLT